MNPAGIRIEEKKSADSASFDESTSPSHISYKSTHSSRSSVLERAREYNRRIEQHRRRAKSLERPEQHESGGSDAGNSRDSYSTTRRSVSTGRVPIRSAGSGNNHNRLSTRERAMASVRKDSAKAAAAASSSSSRRGVSQSTDQTHPLTPASNYSSSHVSRPSPTTPAATTMTTTTTTRRTTTTPTTTASSSNHPNAARHYQHHGGSRSASAAAAATTTRSTSSSKQQQQAFNKKASPGSRSLKSKSTATHSNSAVPRATNGEQQQQQQQEAVVTPELLVDALSGHEDGLLAIAERLMEHYDAGYDVMGEAIIDAFADVQKLFQHVVEAAHMEGAAFEASRREEEIAELRRQVVSASAGELEQQTVTPTAAAASPNAPTRHDEFIDQDVKDVLTEAIRKGSTLRDANKHKECYELFENACQAASALLPVDSDHRGRLQLSIARADSMSPDRACAILRYTMDDVLRSGMRAVRTPLPDPSKRQDVVLTRPKAHPSLGGGGLSGQAGVIQSSDEALASLIEEMKEIMSAPVYNDTPLQSVASRFWVALNEAQKVQRKSEARLEQQLGKLKGDFLLAKAEWEEKLNQANEKADTVKEKYERLKQTSRMDGVDRSFSSRTYDEDNDMSTMYGSVKTAASARAGSVASLGSGLAQQAKTIVSSMNTFNCTTLNERTGASMEADMREFDMPYQGRDRKQRTAADRGDRGRSASNRARSASRGKSSRSFREYSKSPKRVDV